MKAVVPQESVETHEGDLPSAYLDQIRRLGVLAWDIETSGLDWRKDRIATCQVFMPTGHPIIVRINRHKPKRLMLLLADTSVRKVFHHAMFDLRFMSHNWRVAPKNVACTKIASKLLDADGKGEHSLKPLLERHLGVVINKDLQRSDWLSLELSQAQLAYAATDVIYLIPLLEVLERELESRGLLDLAHSCFDHIPTRVRLELLGYPDVYTY